VKKVNRKILIVATLVILAVLVSSLIVVSQANLLDKFKPKYVDYTFRYTSNPNAAGARVITSTDTSRFPVIVIKGYYTDLSIVAANVTINDVTYTYPKDFDYNFTLHFELNTVTGFGLMMIQETLYFNNLHGHPTLIGLTEEKATNYLAPYTNFEFSGNFQVSGTGMFKGVEGSGYSAFGASTGLVAYHIAQISGWQSDIDDHR
jgi:hypothetical protein